MPITQTITALPTPPSSTADDSATFSAKADASLAAMVGMVAEFNTAAGQANTLETNVTALEAAATTSKNAAALSEGNAGTSEANALASKNAAAVSEGNAAVSEANSLAYLQAYRATSYGALAADPIVDPNGNPPTEGDEYFNTVSKLILRFNGATWQASDISTANLAASSGSALVGQDTTTVAGVFKDRMFRRVADVAALRALDKTKNTAAKITAYAADTGAAAGDYLYDSADATTAESLPYVIVATDGGRWKLNSPMMPAPQDALPVGLITRDRGQIGPVIPRQLGLSADNAQVSLDLPLHIGTRRNLWQYTEDFASNRYTAGGATKQADTIVVDGITLTRLTSANFYGSITTNFSGLGLAPFVAGQRYLMSYYVVNRGDLEQFFWMRPLAGGNYGHGAKLAAPRMRRVWQEVQAVSTSAVTAITTPTTALGGETSGNYWFFQGTLDTGATSLEMFVGGFMFEKLAISTYKDGIALIGDSTMAGSSGKVDLTNSREVSTWLGALLNVNVFNRAVGGDQTSSMDARWAADMTPLAVNCRYAIIQGGINDVANSRLLADIKTSIGSMVTKATADGMTPILFTCTPTASIAAVAAKESDRLALNAWMKQTYPYVIDIASVVADPHNPAYLRRAKDWYGDGTHYGVKAKRAIAAYVAQWSGWNFITPSPYQAIPVDTYNPPAAALTHNGIKLLGAQSAAIANATDAATAITQLNLLLAAARTHGLIAT